MRESTANCEQIKSEIEKIQRRQQEFAKNKEKKKKITETVVTRSRPESRMEVDEAPRASGGFNLNRVAQEHMNEGLESWTSPEAAPSMWNQETGRIRPLMDIVLPGFTPSSASGS